MIDEWAEEKNFFDTQTELYRDPVQEKYNFIKKPLTEEGIDQFSTNIKEHLSEGKLVALDMIEVLMRYLKKLFIEKDDFMLI